jgi:hypothetical protein
VKKIRNIASGIKYGYRSGLEEKVALQLMELNISVKFETVKLKYCKPITWHTYTPDFILPNGIIIETKGRFVVKDRKKHLLVRDQYPDLDIRFVFTNPNNKLYKGAKSTYGDWCDKHGFLYSKQKIPKEWLK